MLHGSGERGMSAITDLEEPPLQLLKLPIDGRVEGAFRRLDHHSSSLGSDQGFFVFCGVGGGVCGRGVGWGGPL